MSTHLVITMIDEQPTFAKPLPDILAELKPGGALKTLSPIEYHTDRQNKWYQGICLTGLADWSGDTKEEWDWRLKTFCGQGLLKKENVYTTIDITVTRLTTKGVGKKNFTAFIENILSRAITMEWPVTEPDPELRK